MLARKPPTRKHPTPLPAPRAEQITQTFTIGMGFMVVWEIIAVLLAVALFIFVEAGNYLQATPVQT